MLDIAALVPHAGAMCLLSGVVSWSAGRINCAAHSRLDPANPLRRDGRLGIGCAVEYAMQAAAAHGALRDGAAQKPGYLAALRGVRFHVGRLDDPAHGVLDVEAWVEHASSAGLIYGFAVRSEAGAVLAEGRATVTLPG